MLCNFQKIFARFVILKQTVMQQFSIFSRYKYETSVSHSTAINNSESALPCHANHSLTDADETSDLEAQMGTWPAHSVY